MRSITEMIVGSMALDYSTDSEIQEMIDAHTATRTPEIEEKKQELLDTYGPILGEYVVYLLNCYKKGTRLDDLLDELEKEARCVQSDLL